MRNTICALLLVAGVLCLSGAARAESDPKAAEIIAKLAAGMKEIKTVEFDLSISGISVPKDGIKGHYRAMPAEKKYDMEFKMKMEGLAINAKSVCDGKIVWTEMPIQPGMVMVTKGTTEDAAKAGMGDPFDDVNEFQDKYHFVKLENGTFDGNEVHVITAKFKPGKKEEELLIETVMIHLRKSDNMLVRLDHLDANGKAMVVMEMTKIKTNTAFPEKCFDYAPPPGAQVMDLRDMPKLPK